MLPIPDQVAQRVITAMRGAEAQLRDAAVYQDHRGDAHHAIRDYPMRDYHRDRAAQARETAARLRNLADNLERRAAKTRRRLRAV